MATRAWPRETAMPECPQLVESGHSGEGADSHQTFFAATERLPLAANYRPRRKRPLLIRQNLTVNPIVARGEPGCLHRPPNISAFVQQGHVDRGHTETLPAASNVCNGWKSDIPALAATGFDAAVGFPVMLAIQPSVAIYRYAKFPSKPPTYDSNLRVADGLWVRHGSFLTTCCASRGYGPAP